MEIPGFDETEGKFTKIQTHKVAQEGYWSLNLTGLKQGDKTIDVDNIFGVIDSGTSLIAGPKALVDQLIDGIVVDKKCKGIESLPDLTFTLDDTEYVLKYSDYVLQLSETQCILGIQAIDAPQVSTTSSWETSSCAHTQPSSIRSTTRLLSSTRTPPKSSSDQIKVV